ncbi:MAG: AIR synthase-related protein [Polyangiaceae bacterium]
MSGAMGHDLQDDCSAVAYGWAKRTFDVRDGLEGRPLPAPVAPFSSMLDVLGKRIAVTSDGVGTKVEIAERMRRYDTLGHDLVAMVTDDLAANAVEPFALTNTLDVDKLDKEVVDDLMRGLHDAARIAKVAVVGGEIAELGSRIGGFGHGMHFNWCATAVGIVRPEFGFVDGSKVRPGDGIVTLHSEGLRSNGFSLARRILAQKLGESWHDELFEGQRWGEWLLTPCRIYAPAITHLQQSGITLHGLAHITGGGFPSKFGRTLRATGSGAHLETLFPAEPFLKQLCEWGDVPAEEAYRQWNMSNGFVVVVPEPEIHKAIAALAAAGHRAQLAGHVTADPRMRILTENETLTYTL